MYFLLCDVVVSFHFRYRLWDFLFIFPTAYFPFVFLFLHIMFFFRFLLITSFIIGKFHLVVVNDAFLVICRPVYPESVCVSFVLYCRFVFNISITDDLNVVSTFSVDVWTMRWFRWSFCSSVALWYRLKIFRTLSFNRCVTSHVIFI